MMHRRAGTNLNGLGLRPPLHKTFCQHTCSFLQPSDRERTPLEVTISHQEMSRWTSPGQPWASACKEISVTAEQELTSRYCNLWQCKERLWLVRSEIFLQYLRSRCSMLLQYWEKVASALSPTAWQPRRLSFRRKPPHRRAMFSTTMPSMSIWNSNRSTYCQLDPSRAKMFHALDTYENIQVSNMLKIQQHFMLSHSIYKNILQLSNFHLDLRSFQWCRKGKNLWGQ